MAKTQNMSSTKVIQTAPGLKNVDAPMQFFPHLFTFWTVNATTHLEPSDQISGYNGREAR